MKSHHKHLVAACITLGALTPLQANAGIFDSVKNWFGEITGSSNTTTATPGINGQGGTSMASQSAAAKDAAAKANCDDLNGQLANTQAEAINQRNQAKSVSQAISDFGINDLINKRIDMKTFMANAQNVGTQYLKNAAKTSAANAAATATTATPGIAPQTSNTNSLR